MTPGQPPGAPLRASRAERGGRERRRRRAEALVTVVVVVVVGAYAWAQARESGAGAPVSSPSASATASGLGEPTRFLAFSVTGAPGPLLAVVGTGSGGRKPAALPVPMGLTLVVPGGGEMRAKDVSLLRGRSVQVALSNLLGVWAEHYAVTDVDRLASMVDRNGGLEADLSLGVVTPSGAFGPGKVSLTGAQVKDLLVSTQGTQAETAWSAVITALLSHPPVLTRSDLAATDDLAGATSILDGVSGATTIKMPTRTIAGATLVPSRPELDALLSATFGTSPAVATIVQNGSGIPGVGEAVARRILPAGFRVVVSENAASFNHATTEITANGRNNVAVAKRLRKALKVGRVTLSRVPSGIGDITVVVGKDFRV